jgi:hypothetical protein
MSYSCKNCNNRNTQAISYLYAKHTKNSTSVGFAMTGDGVSRGIAWSNEASLVSRWFAPPQKPGLSLLHVIAVVLISVPGILAAVVGMNRSADSPTFRFWAVLFLFVSAGFGLSFLFKSMVDKALPVWKKKDAIYRRLVHCSRCNYVTDVITGKTTQANRITTLY